MLFESNRQEFDRALSLFSRIMDLEDDNILVKYEPYIRFGPLASGARNGEIPVN